MVHIHNKVQARAEDLPRGVIRGGKAEIMDLVHGRLPGVRSIRYHDVTRDEATKMKAALGEDVGIDLEGFHHCVDESSINHARNSHGIPKEFLRGQSPITDQDFQYIPEIVTHPDSISYAGESGIGLPVIRYEKRIGEKYYYLEEIRTGRHELVAKTLWKVP